MLISGNVVLWQLMLLRQLMHVSAIGSSLLNDPTDRAAREAGPKESKESQAEPKQASGSTAVASGASAGDWGGAIASGRETHRTRVDGILAQGPGGAKARENPNNIAQKRKQASGSTAGDGGRAISSAPPLPPIMNEPRTPANVLESLKLPSNKLTLDVAWITDAGSQSTIFKLRDSYGYTFALKIFNKYNSHIHSAVHPEHISDKNKQSMATSYYHDVAVPVSLGESPPHLNVPVAYRSGTLLQSYPQFTELHPNFPDDNWTDDLPALRMDDWIDQVKAAIAGSGLIESGFISSEHHDELGKAEFWAFPMVLYEFAQHGDVRSVLVEHRRFSMRSAKQVLDLGTQMLRAIAHMHANDWSHRDIKADNILAFGSNDYRLTDFGLSTSISRPQGFVGSWPNLPPEFWLHQNMDASRDLFSLGTVLYAAVREVNFWRDYLFSGVYNKDAVLKKVRIKFQHLWQFFDTQLFHKDGVPDANPLERAKIELLFRRLLAFHPHSRGTAQGILDDLAEMDHQHERLSV